MAWNVFTCTVVSRKYAPSFETLASVQNAGGLYEGRDNFCRDYALPSDKLSLSVGGGGQA